VRLPSPGAVAATAARLCLRPISGYLGMCFLPVSLGCMAEEMSEAERTVLDDGGELDMERSPDLHCVLRPPLAWLGVMPL
jgi:hypothetical protein